MCYERVTRCGHTTYDEALLELNRRLEIADNDMVMTRIKGAIDTLSKKGDSGFAAFQGVYSFIWAKLGACVSNSATIRYFDSQWS